MMADLSAYEYLNDIEFSQEVKQLMELFAESWEECRCTACGACKYRHGKEMYQLLFCLSERYAEKLISNGFSRVMHGRLANANSSSKTYQRRCTACGGIAYFCGMGCSYKYCPNCGAKMEGGDEDGNEAYRG